MPAEEWGAEGNAATKPGVFRHREQSEVRRGKERNQVPMGSLKHKTS